MSITAKELSKMLSLSEAAVSMALNNKPGVSTATRQRVLAAAREQGYDFTRISGSTAPRIEKGTLSFIKYRKHGAVVADTDFFHELTEGIERACHEANYRLQLNYLYEDDNTARQLKDMSYCNGIILLGTEMRYEDFRLFQNTRTPIVVLDAYYEKLGYDCVVINNAQGIYLAVNYCIQKRRTQPGYLHSSYPVRNFMERADAFTKAIQDNGMSVSRSQVLQLTPSFDGAYEDMLGLLKRGEELANSCYVADNDLIAAGAMKAIKEWGGCRIPEDVGIIGFDDISLCTRIEPMLTTICVPKQYMGKMAVWRLKELLETNDHSPMNLAVNTRIIERGSV